MGQILTFIFNAIKDVLTLLNFDLPGIELIFLDFILLGILIPIIFNFIKGVFGGSGSHLGSSIYSYAVGKVDRGVMKSIKSDKSSNYQPKHVYQPKHAERR